ncbi:MAG: TRAP transporter small permease [Proteobacteria bacterium]|nr:TRAP transporter small permease [Pseudomonadota bacterium]
MQHEHEGETNSPSFVARPVCMIAQWATALAALLVLVVLFSVAYSVLLRYGLGTPITWTDELTGYLVVAMVVLGAAGTLLRNEHISVDLLTAQLKPTGRHLVEIWSMLCIALVCAAWLYSGWRMVRYSYQFGMRSEGYLSTPMWIPHAAFLVGISLLLVAALARLVRLLRRGRPTDLPPGAS